MSAPPPSSRLPRIKLPDGLTPTDADHVARLLEAIADGQWRYLAATFERLADAGVGRWPGSAGELLHTLTVELRRWAARGELAGRVVPEPARRAR